MKKKSYIFLAALAALSMAACSEDNDVIIPEKSPVEMIWDGLTINQNESPQWCVSRSNSWVAMTNVSEKSQYYLSWDGGLSVGEKSNASLRISANGSKPVEYELSTFVITYDGVNYTYSFSSADGASGSFTFPLETE